MTHLATLIPWSAHLWYLVPLAALALFVLAGPSLSELKQPAAWRSLGPRLVPSLVFILTFAEALILISLWLGVQAALAMKPTGYEGFGQLLVRRSRQKRRVILVTSGLWVTLFLVFVGGHGQDWMSTLGHQWHIWIPIVLVPTAYFVLSTPRVRGKRAIFFKRDEARQITTAQKAEVFSRDQALCVYCHIKLHRGVWDRCSHKARNCGCTEFDHVVPHSRGGKSVVTNIVASCRPCNRGKGNEYDLESRLMALYLRRWYHQSAKVQATGVPEASSGWVSSQRSHSKVRI